MCEYRNMYIPGARRKELRRGGARPGSVGPVCAGLYDFVMSHYADEVRCMRFSCGCTVPSDMKKKKGDNVI